MKPLQKLSNLSFQMVLIVAFSVLLFGQRAKAQGVDTAPDRGITPGKSYAISDIETIAMQSGNMMVNIPLGSLPPGRGGMSGSVNLTYNSKLWNMNSLDGLDRHGGEVTLNTLKASEEGGWHYGYMYYFRVDHGVGNCGDFLERIQLVKPDGGTHTLLPGDGTNALSDDNDYSKITPDGRSCAGGTVTPGQTVRLFSTDNSFLRMEVITDSDDDFNNNRWTLYARDGTRVVNRPPEDATVSQRIYDRNGNYIDIIENAADADYSNHRTTYLKDIFERRVVIEYDTDTNEDSIHSASVAGVDTVTRVTWKNISVNKTYDICGCSAPSPHDPDDWQNFGLNKPLRVVDEVYLPSQVIGDLHYEFGYNADSTMAADVGWGEIDEIILPSGAKSLYKYKYDYPTGFSVAAEEVLANGVVEKRLEYDLEYDGTTTPASDVWTYERPVPGDRGLMTAPDGSVMTEYYGSGNPAINLPGEVYKTENGDGAVIERWYESNAPGVSNVPSYPNSLYKANRYVKFEFISIPDASGSLTKTAVKEYSRDKNGNVTEVKEFDYVAYSAVPRNGDGRPYTLPSGITPIRTSKTEYYNDTPDASVATYTDADIYSQSSSPRLLNLPKSIEVQNGTATPKSRSEMTYDYTNYSTNSKGGNLTQSKVWDSFKGGSSQTYSNPLTSTNSITTSATYNYYGMPLTTTDANGVVTQITYGDVAGPNGPVTDLYPTQTVSAYGTAVARTSSAVYDFYTGLATRSTDEDNDLTNATEYDELGRPIKSIAAQGTALEVWTTTEYHDADRFVVVKSDLETKGDGKKVVTQFYDQLGRVRLSKTVEDAATQSATNETDGIKVQTRYATTYSSPNGYTYQLTSNPYRASTSGGASTEETMGWTRSKAWHTGTKQEVETFSGSGLPAPWGSNSSSTGVVTTDIDADRTLVTDLAGKQRISRTNALGQLKDIWEITAQDSSTVAVTFPNTSIAYGYQTSYGYDTLNNLTTVNQGSQTRTFTYSSLSRLLSATNPESGTISYAYDPNGNLTSKVDARSITTAYSYDALNRVTQRAYTNEPSGSETPDVTYTYGTVAPAIGKLKKVESSVSTTEYTSFDILGRVTASKQTTDGITYGNGTTDSLMTYTYNLSGALIEQQYPSGRVVKNVLDNNGDLSIVQSKKNSLSGYWHYADSFTYNAAGAVTSMQLGNGRWESTIFNSRLQPTQIAVGTIQNGTDKLQLDYGYGTSENNGNVLSQKITVKRAGQSDLVFDQTYSYDPLNRITSAEEKTGTTTNWLQTYTFDRYGNRNFNESATTTLPKNCGTAPNFTVCPADIPVVNPSVNAGNNRLNGTTYDAAGNVIIDAEGREFTYDAENKQIEVENSTSQTVGQYRFDGGGKRVKKIVPSTSEVTIFVYDAGGKLVAEYSTNISPVQDAKVQYLTNDNLGTPRINTDANGAITSRSDYMPYGEEIVGLGGRSGDDRYVADDVRRGFTGYEKDDETGLDFAQARMYSHGLGRFTSSDRIMIELKRVLDPQGINRYIYARNNPLGFTDPSGKTYVGTDGKEVDVEFNKDGTIKKLGKNATGDLRKIVDRINKSGSAKALSQFKKGFESQTKFHVVIHSESDRRATGNNSGLMRPHDAAGNEIKDLYGRDAAYIEDKETGKLIYKEVTINLWEYGEAEEWTALWFLRQTSNYSDLGREDAMVATFGHEIHHGTDQEDINAIRGRRHFGGYTYNLRTYNIDAEEKAWKVSHEIIDEIEKVKSVSKPN